MRSFKSLPSTGEQRDYFSAYAKFSGKISMLALAAQVLSALTESVIFYSLGYDTFLPFGANLAVFTGIVAAFLGVVLIEVFGLRICVPQVTKQFLYRRFNGGHLSMTLFVTIITAALVFVSLKLSLDGGQITVTNQLGKVKESKDDFIRQEHSVHLAVADSLEVVDRAEIESRYELLIASVNRSFSASIGEAESDLRTWVSKRGNYQTRVNRARTKIASLEADRSERLADFALDKSKELKLLKESRTASRDSLQSVFTARLVDNEGGYVETESTFKSATRYAVWLAIFLSIVCIVIKTIFQKNSGQEETPLPDDYTFRESAASEAWEAVKERVNVYVRNGIAAFEGNTPVAELSERVNTVYDRADWRELVVKLQVEDLAEGDKIVRIPAPKRAIGFKRYTVDAVDTGIDLAVTANATVSNERLCRACGKDISHKRSDAKHCDKGCRLQYHSEKRGKLFDPGLYHGKKRK